MAFLDVLDAISDPMFTDEVTVCRVTQSLGTNGRVTGGETSTTITAVVQPGEGRNVDVFDGGQQVLESLNIFSVYQFVAAAPGITGDEISWSGRRWRVTKVIDYANFGSGYTQATCMLKTPTQ